jgi:hypothetical protein
MASTKTARRHADPDPHRKAPLRHGDDFAWVAWHLEVPSLFLYRLHAGFSGVQPVGPAAPLGYGWIMCGRARLSSEVSEIKLVFSIPAASAEPQLPAELECGAD